MGNGSLSIGVVDHRANIGGGRRFTSSIARGFAQVVGGSNVRLIAVKEALDEQWFGYLQEVPLETFGLVTEQTMRRWLPDGRTFGLPGTWRLKASLRGVLLETRFEMKKQLERALKGFDVAYFPWPYFIEFHDFGVPVVCTLHDLIWKNVQVANPQEASTLDKQIPVWLANSQAVVTSTDYMKSEIQKFYPHCAKRIQVIPVAASDLSVPAGNVSRDQVFARWNVSGKFALCPAGLWPHKNHENLVRSIALLKQRGSNLALVCTGMYTDHAFGSNPPNQLWARARHLRELAFELGLTPGREIIGLGHVSDEELGMLYRAATCLVMAVFYEAGSLPILEGAAQGLPIACSDIPVYREQTDIYGLEPVYFDPNSPDSIADALERLVRSRPSLEELNRISQCVRARTWQDVAREYLQVFESVL